MRSGRGIVGHRRSQTGGGSSHDSCRALRWVAVSAVDGVQEPDVSRFDAQSNFSDVVESPVLALCRGSRYAAVTNPNIVPVLLGCCALALFDVRYAAGLALLLPLFLLHLLSVRDEQGTSRCFRVAVVASAVIWIVLWPDAGTGSVAGQALTIVVLPSR